MRHRELRATNLQRPMIPLERAGFLSPSKTDSDWNRQAEAVGFGPAGEAVAVWSSRTVEGRRLVTWHSEEAEPVRSAVLDGAIQATYVQPAADGGVLLVAARKPPAMPSNAQRWSAVGELVAEGDFGDAILHVLATDSGDVWVGYFDEAHGSTGPGAHGLVRFGPDLKPVWEYPWDPGLPSVFDCYTLNVVQQVAWTCPYTDFHLISIDADAVLDRGKSPYQGASGLLIDGERGALIGGYGPNYDLVVPFELTPAGLVAKGRMGRVVMPDGLEVPGQGWCCRGGHARIHINGTRYTLSLMSVFDALV